ncbi:MAG: FAD-dependent oxidoreductase, partial [Streptomycetaceae bacterium]|nr:FAD-dependent oxidoreductase [Streptomycetaceae bacterium]
MVVGGGPAGIAAALAAAKAGVDVLLVDNGRTVGGQFNRQLPVEFAARRPDRLQHGWKSFAAQRDLLAESPRITHLNETSVWAVERIGEPIADTARVGALAEGAGHGPSTVPSQQTADQQTADQQTADQQAADLQAADQQTAASHRLWALRGPADAVGRTPFPIDAKAVVLATGAYDRVLPFPGWDLPGVYTAGAAQALAKGQRISVGRRVLVAGTGPFLLPVAESLVGVGAEVVGLLEANSLGTVRKGWSSDPTVAAGKLREAAGYGAVLARHRIPLRHGWTVVAAHGADHVEAVTIARVDGSWR